MSSPLPNNRDIEAQASQLTGTITDTIINEWLDRWDESWQPGIEHLKAIVNESGFVSDARSLAELIRVDIDRRYAIDKCLPLADYFHAFPSLFADTDALSAIAFEDFRARRSAGLDCPRTRWSWVPGIGRQVWFAEINEPDRVLNATREPEVGRDFGEFRLVCLLGEGTFSKVYLATQRLLGDRYVALKVVRRTLSEPYHLARLHHTGIVPLFSLHRINEYSALCMPYSGAATLADWLQATHQPGSKEPIKSLRTGQSLVDTVVGTQARLNVQTLTELPRTMLNALSSDAQTHTERRQSQTNLSMRPLASLVDMQGLELTLWLACRLAAALAHAHARGIAHGDLKPANILLRNDGEPSLIDFNLAREDDAQDQKWIGGTLPYMAPEQMKAVIGRSCLLTFSSDVYSLGMILYEILEGHLPYATPNSTAECDLDPAIVARQSAVLKFTQSQGILGLQAIIHKCLAFDSLNRYKDGEQLLEDLERERQNLPLKHAREPLSSRTRKLFRRHPTVLSNTVIAGLAISITLAGILFGWAGLKQWQSAAAQNSSVQLITSLENEQFKFLDLPAEDVPARTSNRLVQIRSTLDSSTDQLVNSRILNRVPKADRDVLLQSLFEQSLAMTWLTIERTAEISDAGSARDVHRIEMIQWLSQFPDHTPNSLLYNQLLQSSQHMKMTANDTLFSRARALLDGGQLSLPGLTATERIIWARILTLSGDSSTALQHLAAVRDGRTNRFLYWDTFGKAQTRAGQHALARQSFSMAIEAAPHCLSSYGQCAAARLSIGDYSGAETDLTVAIELARPPEGLILSELLVQRAMVRERLNKLQPALNDVDRAIDLAHESSRLLLLRSRLARKMGDRLRARDDLEAGLKSEPKSSGDWIARGLARANEEPLRAMEDFRNALSIAPNSVSALQNMAYVQTDLLHEEENAIASLDRIIQIQPDHEGARGGRCVLLARAGKSDLAFEDIRYLEQHVVRLQPATIYQFGCAHALLVKQHPECLTKAIQYLLQSLSSYGANVIESDPDLDNLRSQPAFQNLLELSKSLIKT